MPEKPDVYGVYRGCVSNVLEFGCFVELQGFRKKAEGLVHTSNISKQRRVSTFLPSQKPVGVAACRPTCSIFGKASVRCIVRQGLCFHSLQAGSCGTCKRHFLDTYVMLMQTLAAVTGAPCCNSSGTRVSGRRTC